MIDPVPEIDHVESSNSESMARAANTMKYLAPRRRFGAADKTEAYYGLLEKIKLYRPFIEAKLRQMLDQTEPETTGAIQEPYEKLMAEIVRDVIVRTERLEWERNNEFHSSPDPASEYVRALL